MPKYKAFWKLALNNYIYFWCDWNRKNNNLSKYIDELHFSIAIFPLQSQTAPEKLVVVFMYKHAIFMYILEFNPTDNCTINADGTVANQIK